MIEANGRASFLLKSFSLLSPLYHYEKIEKSLAILLMNYLARALYAMELVTQAYLQTALITERRPLDRHKSVVAVMKEGWKRF